MANMIEQVKQAMQMRKEAKRMQAEIEKITGVPEDVATTDEVVGLVEYRDGTFIDSIWKVR